MVSRGEGCRRRHLDCGPWQQSSSPKNPLGYPERTMTVRRFVLVDFRYASDVVGHIRLYEAGNTYDMLRALAHAAVKRELPHNGLSNGNHRVS